MRIVGTKILHCGHKFNLAENELATDDGATVRREFVDHPGAVVILPLLSDSQLVMLRNYRHPLDQVLWEVPAGTRSVGEPAEITAARELLEETGYRAGQLQKLLEFFPAPGISNELMTIFVATELQSAVAARELDESMDVEILAVDRVLEMSSNGEIKDGKTLVAVWAWWLLPRNAWASERIPSVECKGEQT